ncbi:MAG: hypothetical protein HDR98_06590 [Bacteroides sp.]|nr:hypothetical protein [Bacteroides sp.]
MRKALLMLLLLVGLLGNAAVNESLRYYTSDFTDPTSENPLCGWTCFGNSSEAADVMLGSSDTPLNDFFTAGSEAYLVLNFKGYGNLPCSNSSFKDGSSADQWLVSPEIDLTNAPANIMLDFDVICYGSSNESKFEVYVSESGNSREDFTGKPVYSGRQKGSAKEIIKATIHKALKDVGGKRIWLAFVNKSTDAQITGFTNVSLAEYDIDLINHTPSFTTEAGSFDVSMDVSIMTPVSCKGFTAVLSDSDGKKQEYISEKQLSSRYNTYSFTFPAPITVSFGEVYDYTISLTPNYEGATPTVISGTLVCREGYPATCVMEEGTGSWCGYCVRGNAALKYYADLYGDRFIGIAVHNDDPMDVYDYSSNWKNQSGLNSFPSAWINRTMASDPAMGFPLVEAETMKRVGQKVTIDSVEFDPNSFTATVKYSPEFCSDMEDVDVTAVAIVTENDCKGTGKEWFQNNNYSGATLDSWTAEGLPEAMWEYVYDYTLEPSLIPSEKYGFNHVAMGVFNNYYGDNTWLSKTWEGGVPQQYSLTFDFPMQESKNTAGVQDWHNTEVVVLLLDRATGAILNADIMPASQYTVEDSGVAAIDSNIEITKGMDCIMVHACPGACVEVYGIDGILLKSETSDSDSYCMKLSGLKGLVGVRVVVGNHTVVKKLML